MLVLAIETSSPRGSLALLEGRTVVDRTLFPEGLVHGREITVHLRDMCDRRGIPPRGLGAVVVGLGPGSYTGIRVGVTAAKSLAMALRIPIFGESSLRVLASNALAGAPGAAAGSEIFVAPAVDGKQGHIYLALFRVRPATPGRDGDLERLVEDLVVEIPKRPGPLPDGVRAALGRFLISGAIVVGDGADSALAVAGASGVLRGPRDWDIPLASELGGLAARAIEVSPPAFDQEAVHRLVPVYLRASTAERKYPAGLLLPRAHRPAEGSAAP